ncbi:hypothetical protein RHGRI_014555 [Rhododendron griersonianum]|uniref:PB1 domain-containing protein n=1 Tax=Rhododendron griersonianum TaxID=479676 RepID=A0AAV6K9S8_9ERIC|nr:hypothetical protein RHGRI_014555 [Rhododendron griersonianum]
MIWHPSLDGSLDGSLYLSLIQFWAATKTTEGRTLLTTQNQPFALGPTDYKRARHSLCEYRMRMCREYNYFCADAESGEEQLGLPGRVFLHKFPESAPNVNYYSLKEYPQLDLALHCEICGSLALPEFGLQCSNGYKHYEMQVSGKGSEKYPNVTIPSKQYRDENKARTAAIRELKMVLTSVCEVHELPLAMTWVPCSACNGLVRGQLRSKGVEFCAHRDGVCRDERLELLKVSKCSHFRNGHVTGWALSSPNMLYCSDITQLSLAVYPLVPYARWCGFHGWFTICLQSSYTANDIYVLEFFLPTSYRYVDNSWTSLGFILRTMEEKFKTFKLASGQEFGDLLSVEVVDFQNGQKLHSVQLIQATRFSPSLEPLKDGGVMLQLGQLDQPSMDAINNGMNVHVKPAFEDVDMVTIRAKYDNNMIKFRLSLSSTLVELQQEVAKRLNLKARTYYVKYKDEEDELILIACDEDLQDCIHTSRSLGNTSLVVELEPKQTITPLITSLNTAN